MARRERFVADLHIHSYLSRACSRQLHPETLHRWAQLKGLRVLATGDFTHPEWRRELREKLVEAEDGLFKLKPALAEAQDREVPAPCRAPVRFVLGVEISCIYKKGPRVRKLHHLVYAPDWSSAEKLVAKLDKIGNLKSDGRPILGLDSKKLLDLCLESGSRVHLVPAHAWTPHFAVFGSQSGFDSLEECFEDLTPRIFAIETGLSSDPPMNWRVSGLDRVALMSNSDAHSPEKLAREANLFESELSYDGIFGAVKDRDMTRFKGTLEFFPEEGKYHEDGHRACDVRLTPRETIKNGGLCPKCGKPVTVGVLARVEALADREPPKPRAPFEHIVPLREVIGETLKVGPASVKVGRVYQELLARFGPELFVLREQDTRALGEAGWPLLALALSRMRRGEARAEAGYDGVYGTVSLLKPADFAAPAEKQLSLL